MNYNAMLPDLNSLLKMHMPLMYTDPTLKLFFCKAVTVFIKRNQLSKGLLAPSLYPNKKVIRTNAITGFNKCDICKNDLICSNYFTYSVTNRGYYTKGFIHCNCSNFIYLITCNNYLEENIGSSTNFKHRFRIHKSDIKTNKDRYGTVKHFNGMCKNENNIFQFLSVQVIEQVYINATDIEEILWHKG